MMGNRGPVWSQTLLSIDRCRRPSAGALRRSLRTEAAGFVWRSVPCIDGCHCAIGRSTEAFVSCQYSPN